MLGTESGNELGDSANAGKDSQLPPISSQGRNDAEADDEIIRPISPIMALSLKIGEV